MRIALVNNQYQLGGAETVVRQLHSGLNQRGEQAVLHVAMEPQPPRLPRFRLLYPRLLNRLFHSRWHSRVARRFPPLRWTDRAFQRLGGGPWDLIHVHNFHGTYATLESLANVARQRRVVWTFHRLWGITGGCDQPLECSQYLGSCARCPQLGIWPLGKSDDTAAQLSLKKRLLAEAPLHLVAPSEHLAATVRGSLVGSRWPITVIPNGVDTARFDPARKRDPALKRALGLDPRLLVVLVVNRNFEDPLKGFQDVEQALRLTPAGAIQVALAGGQSNLAARRLAPQIPCHDFGYVSDTNQLRQLYEAADVFLFASPYENFPCVVVEAMAAGCCIVSTPTSGVTEQIADGVHGILADERTGPSLARALHKALQQPAQCRQMGHAARDRAEREFSETRMIDRHLALYRSLREEG